MGGKRAKASQEKRRDESKKADVLQTIDTHGLASRKSGHVVWRHFRRYKPGPLLPKGKERMAVCLLCMEDQSYVEVSAGTGNTTNLMKHLKHNHLSVHDAIMDEKDDLGRSTVDLLRADGQPTISSKFGPAKKSSGGLPDWQDAVLEYIVMNNRPLSTVEDRSFQQMCRVLGGPGKAMNRSALHTIARAKEREFNKVIDEILEGQVVTACVDTWTGNGVTFMGVTLHWIDKQWKLRSLTADVRKIEGRTAAEELKEKILSAVKARGDVVVWMVVSDCEPSMIAALRELRCADDPDRALLSSGCACHRLESTNGHVFRVPAVHGFLCKCRDISSYYHKSTQAVDRLKTFCHIHRLDFIMPKQDVRTRWWSTYSMLESILHLAPVLRHTLQGGVNEDKAEEACANLTAEEWELLPLVLEVLQPLQAAQLALEGEKYLTGSCLIDTVFDIRNGFEAIIARDRATADQVIDEAADQDDRDAAKAEIANAKRRLDLAAGLLKDFNNRWGDGTKITKEAEGPRRQPKGFSHNHVLAAVLDPRFKALKGVPADEHEQVWALLQEYLTNLIKKQRAAAGQPPVIAQARARGNEGLNPDDTDYDSNAEERAAQEAAAAAAAAAVSIKVWRRPFVAPEDAAKACIDAYKLWRPGKNIKKKKPPEDGPVDPLEIWRNKEALDTFGQLADLARIVLAAPASSAPVERVFSEAGQIAGTRRSRLCPDNLSTLCFLHNAWTDVREWRVEKGLCDS